MLFVYTRKEILSNFSLEKTPSTKRLNDNEWKEMLTWNNRTNYLPEWFEDVYGSGDPWATPEYPNGIVLVIVMTITLTVVVLRKIVKIKNHIFSNKIV